MSKLRKTPELELLDRVGSLLVRLMTRLQAGEYGFIDYEDYRAISRASLAVEKIERDVMSGRTLVQDEGVDDV